MESGGAWRAVHQSAERSSELQTGCRTADSVCLRRMASRRHEQALRERTGNPVTQVLHSGEPAPAGALRAGHLRAGIQSRCTCTRRTCHTCTGTANGAVWRGVHEGWEAALKRDDELREDVLAGKCLYTFREAEHYFRWARRRPSSQRR